MTRNLKTLGLAFVAVFAMSAIAASAAQATEYFHQHEEHTIITAENVGAGHTGAHTFQLNTAVANTKVECTITKFDGTEIELEKHENVTTGTTWTKESLTVTPTYSGCTLAGNAATVDTKTNECHFKLFAATTETVAGKPHGNVEIICKKAGGITVSVPALGVVIAVPNQLVAHAINYTNVNTLGGTNNEEVTLNVTTPDNISWTCTPKATCTAGLGAAAGTEAGYKGLATAKGFEDLNKAEDTGKTGVYNEGPQRGIWKGPTL